MFYIPSFLRDSFLVVHALRRSWWTIFLLSSALCFLVSSYTIDDSCQNYKGSDIKRDIASAVVEMRAMIKQAHRMSVVRSRSTIDLLVSLFGPNHERQSHILTLYFMTLSKKVVDGDYVIICDDQSVELRPDIFHQPPNPHGVWADPSHGWAGVNFEEFTKCDQTRQVRDSRTYAYVMHKRFIYLCPDVLDNPKGRSNWRHKLNNLRGEFIDDYMLLPVVLLHQMLHVVMDLCKPSLSLSTPSTL